MSKKIRKNSVGNRISSLLQFRKCSGSVSHRKLPKTGINLYDVDVMNCERRYNVQHKIRVESCELKEVLEQNLTA